MMTEFRPAPRIALLGVLASSQALGQELTPTPAEAPQNMARRPKTAWHLGAPEAIRRPKPAAAELVYSGDGLTAVRFRAANGQLMERREPLPPDTELADDGDGWVVVRFRDESGQLIERLYAERHTIDDYIDGEGKMTKRVVRHSDGRVDSIARAYREVHGVHGRPASEAEAVVFAQGINLDRETFQDFLARLPPPPIASSEAQRSLMHGRPRPVDETSTVEHPWRRHLKEGDFSSRARRTDVRLLHRELQVESVRLGESWLQFSDSLGGRRFDRYTRTSQLEVDGHSPPVRAVASHDAMGRIAHVVTNDDGYPTETWYGETLVARYHYAHVDGVAPRPSDGRLGDFWFELLEPLTGRRLLDSRALPIVSDEPRFSALSGLIESVDDDLFVVVNHGPWGERYALLPLGEGPIWRAVLAAGTEDPSLRSQVYYTDDRLRIEFRFRGQRTDLVVEAPRRGSSSIKVRWPRDIELPLLLKEPTAPSPP